MAAGFPNMFPPPKRLGGAEVLPAAGVVESVGLVDTPGSPPAAGVGPKIMRH